MEKREIARLERAVKRSMNGCWDYIGGKFYKTQRIKIGDVHPVVELTSDARQIHAKVLTKGDYGIEDAEKTFEGASLIQDCATWIAERLAELYETVEERTSPYWGGYRDYQRALHGEE